MRGEHKFVRTHEGVLGFALVSVDSQPSQSWEIVWQDADHLAPLRSVFGAAVETGVRLAATAHETLGGSPQRVEILSLGHNPADTRSDAVICAAALAAWKAWGHSPSQAHIAYDGGWTVAFPTTS